MPSVSTSSTSCPSTLRTSTTMRTNATSAPCSLRQALAEDHHVIQPFDQDSWAKNYAAYDLPEALEAFKSFRHWNLKLINAQPPAAFDKPVTHPERGAMTFRTLVETMAGHDLNHLRQIEALQ